MKKREKRALMKAMLKQVRKLLASTLAAHPAGAELAGKKGDPLLRDWAPVFERIVRERPYKPQTIKNHATNVGHVVRLWGSCSVRALKPHHISATLREFLPERAASARRVLAELREMYAEAIANGWAEYNPATHVRQPPHRIKRKRLTLEVWQGMRELASAGRQKWVESMLLLALVTGQRRADLAKMRFDDVVDGHLRIEQQKQAGKGYGARVEIPVALRLDAIGMSVGDVIEHCRTSAREGPTLLRKVGGGSIEESSLSMRFNEYIRALLGRDAHGDHEWPSLHEVRSLAARLYRAQGTDVQTLLGHKHAEMTAIYEDDRGLSAGQWKRVAV